MKNKTLAQFKGKIIKKSAVIGIVGLGYVGLPLAFEFARKGFAVIGLDTDSKRIKSVNSGRCYIRDIDGAEFGRLCRRKQSRATSDYSVLRESDVVIVCVPTSLRKTIVPDISYIVRSTRMIAK